MLGVSAVGEQLISVDCLMNNYDPAKSDDFPLSYKKSVFYMTFPILCVLIPMFYFR